MIVHSIVLVLVTAIWGISFIAVKWTFQDFSPTWANCFRYTLSLAAAIPFLLYFKSYKRSLKELSYPFYSSLLLFSGMLTQTIGLSITTVAKNSFITTFYAFIIPIFMMILFKKRYSFKYWMVVMMAMLGMAMLCNLSIEDVNVGDLYSLACAFFMAAHIIYLDRILVHYDSSFEFNSLQCFYIGIYGFAYAWMVDGPIDITPLLDMSALTRPSSLTGMLVAAFLSSFLAFAFQAYAQKKVPPHIVSVIFLLEAPFAAIFGFLLLAEDLTVVEIAGCVVVTLAAYLVYLLPESRGHSLANSVIKKE